MTKGATRSFPMTYEHSGDLIILSRQRSRVVWSDEFQDASCQLFADTDNAWYEVVGLNLLSALRWLEDQAG